MKMHVYGVGGCGGGDDITIHVYGGRVGGGWG